MRSPLSYKPPLNFHWIPGQAFRQRQHLSELPFLWPFPPAGPPTTCCLKWPINARNLEDSICARRKTQDRLAVFFARSR